MTEPILPPSPFLPGTKIQFAWDSTSINAIKLCPRLYQLTILEGWVPKDESVHLRFGIEYHAAIQDYENARANGLPRDDAIRETVGNLLKRSRDFDPDPTTKAGRYKNPETLRQLVVDYLDHFRDDPCKTVIREDGRPMVEQSFRFELEWGPRAGTIECHVCGGTGFVGPHNYDGVCSNCGGQKLEGPPQPYLLCGHLDRVVTFNDDTYVLDHKTTVTEPTQYYFSGFSPNNQMTLYSLAGQVVLGSPIRGVIVEAAQVLLEVPNRFVRGFAYRSDQIIHEWLGDLEYHLTCAEDYARANYWPMNDMACGMYGGCKFREVCSKNPEVRKHYLNADFVQLPEEDRWNPLKSR
jgi:hypothetical protein